MKPTRNIVRPNTSLWNPKNKLSIWAIENDDSKLGIEEREKKPESFCPKCKERESTPKFRLCSECWKRSRGFEDAS